ncbi:MAG: carboxylating nicotinate-nucleotide diphosphorylase, partial [Planctomycetaceae bacterium]
MPATRAKLSFSDRERTAAERLIELALQEDLGEQGEDVTCSSLIGTQDQGAVQLVARRAGVLAGLPVARMVFARLDLNIRFEAFVDEGLPLQPGTVAAELSGPLRSLLIGERTALNFLTHLSGVATLTRRYVDAVAGTAATIFDTRKTLPGYRALQKYAVRAGGGANHRMGLFDGCLIKDNHLAAWMASGKAGGIAEAVREARRAVGAGIPVEVEVETLEQLRDALGGLPHIVLLDNMSAAMLGDAVAIRNSVAPSVQLEASG